ncbi:MAG TPA: aspartate carbamoyltransferase, partial [Nitrospirota bacterium]|nr:aspartate carbamoyltransferase [Nitrospirota bacterium]
QRLDDGGRQTVTVKNPSNARQIALIQGHLQHEAEKFRRGDFSDPAKIHGDDMPGLAELKTGIGEIDIRYTALPNGGEIRYTTANPVLVTALHQWFAAQLSDHGRHAMDH